MEFGETPQQTLSREIEEETGLSVKHCELSFCDSICFSHTATSDGSMVELHHIGIVFNVVCDSYLTIKVEPDGLDSNGALWFDLNCDDVERLAPFARMAATI